VLNEVKKVTQM